jgi:hypothetical protein
VPVVLLASFLPFFVEIERVNLAVGDELAVAVLPTTATPSDDDHDWYRALPPELRAQLTQIDSLNLLLAFARRASSRLGPQAATGLPGLEVISTSAFHGAEMTPWSGGTPADLHHPGCWGTFLTAHRRALQTPVLCGGCWGRSQCENHWTAYHR